MAALANPFVSARDLRLPSLSGEICVHFSLLVCSLSPTAGSKDMFHGSVVSVLQQEPGIRFTVLQSHFYGRNQGYISQCIFIFLEHEGTIWHAQKNILQYSGIRPVALDEHFAFQAIFLQRQVLALHLKYSGGIHLKQ